MSIVRSFVTGEGFLRLFSRATVGPIGYLGIRDIHRLIEQEKPNPLPSSIRESMIGHFEVEPIGIGNIESIRTAAIV